MTRTPLAPVRGYPDDVAATYRAAGLWTDETFGEFVVDRCTRFAEREAVVGVDVHGAPHRWNHAELLRRALRFRAVLEGAGVTPGDRVVLALPNVVENLAAVLGTFHLGALPVFGLPTHRSRELVEFCAVADAAALVLAGNAHDVDHVALHAEVARGVTERGVEAPVLVRLDELDALSARHDVVDGGAHGGAHGVADGVADVSTRAGDVAFLQLSGGTTGVSKLIPRTHADYLYSVRASAEICGLAATHPARMLVVLPMAHNFSMSSPGVLGILHVGGCVVMSPDPSPRTAFRLVADESVTHVALVPPLAQAWVQASRRRAPDLSTVRSLQVGGARLAPAVAADVHDVLGVPLQQVFGMAEGLVNYTRPEDPRDVVETTQGRPISDLDEILVVDADDQPVPEGEEGELLTRGPYTIRGYYRSPAADASSFTSDGFYRTGDLVRVLPSGHLRVTGRVKDQINRSGEKIASAEIEEPLLELAEVHDALAVGVPDPVLGERIAVLVVPHDPATPGDAAARDALVAQIRLRLREHGLATHKQPDDVHVVASFPATHVGKNSRRDLRDALARDLSLQTQES